MPERHDRHAEHDAQARSAQPAATRRPPRRAATAPNTRPADGPFHGLLWTHLRRERPAPERAARIVLRGVADDHGQHQQEQRVAAARLADGDHRAERQARGTATETGSPRRVRARRGRRSRRVSVEGAERDERRHQHDVDRRRQAAARTPRTSASPRHRPESPAPAARCSGRAPRIRRIRAPGAARRPPKKTAAGDNQTTAIAKASRIAPLRTRVIADQPGRVSAGSLGAERDRTRGDGLMPPYRRSRF